MNRLAAAFYVEALKARRSLVPWLTGAFAALPPVMMGVMMAIKKHPLESRRLGLLTEKAKLMGGTVDWPTFLGLLGQIMGAVGGIVFAIVTAWMFGREFTDRTCRIMLATPTRRSAIVTAKLGVSAMSCLLLVAWITAVMFVAGFVVGMPGLTWPVAVVALGLTVRAALLSLALIPVTALVASVGRGYLLPIGTALVVLIAAQFIGATGWAVWFPWWVAMSSGVPGTHVAGPSVAVVMLTGLAGFAATLWWWERADQTG
jgi:ABC-2 type transport system permease protein